MYTTTTNIENALGRTLTEGEAAHFTGVLAPAIEAYINKETGVEFGKDSVAEVSVSGEGTSTLVIPTMYHVASVKDEDGNPMDVNSYKTYPASAPYLALINKGGNWSEGLGNYTVSGKVAEAEIPAEIISVATEIAVNYFGVHQDDIKSEKVGDYSVTYSNVEKDVSVRSKDALKGYKRLSRSI